MSSSPSSREPYPTSQRILRRAAIDHQPSFYEPLIRWPTPSSPAPPLSSIFTPYFHARTHAHSTALLDANAPSLPSLRESYDMGFGTPTERARVAARTKSVKKEKLKTVYPPYPPDWARQVAQKRKREEARRRWEVRYGGNAFERREMERARWREEGYAPWVGVLVRRERERARWC